ncbi:hypothetical protein Ddye_015476 [Dipteronia dyeriana]|uniref:TRAM domain-containing protein n=1 Tax=Dipteronia dyeriana TaxID=168575 RepID=A0AAD9WZC2_9ROSI|nr:hypothetical protein Ddye_015476 [Dipteronia dyeriana]
MSCIAAEADTGFVVLCDRALPGEKLIGRITRKKDNYAKATKLKTIIPHWDSVDAPCEYASYCGGCKTQNLSYEAQLRAKEQRVHELVIHAGKFSDKDPEFFSIMKPIFPVIFNFTMETRWSSHLALKRGFLKNHFKRNEFERRIMRWDYILLAFLIRF